MPTPPFSRRQFLGTSLGAGLALGLGGVGRSEAWASAVSRRNRAGVITAPPEPESAQSFVSRPDLAPPGVSITQSTDVKSIPGQPQYIFLCPRLDIPSPRPISGQGLMICDLAGDLVWWQQTGNTVLDNPFDMRVQSYRNQRVLTWYTGTIGTGHGADGTGHIVGSDYSTIAEVRTDLYDGLDLHEFRLTPQNTALVTSYETDQAAGLLYGHALEIDIATGNVEWDWSSKRQVARSASYVANDDYFHINSVDLWPGKARNVLISSRDTWCVYLIDRQTRDIIWRLGGKDNDFTMGPGTKFEYSHDARALVDGSGISLFDNASMPAPGAPPTPEKQSRGKVFDVDEDTMQVTLRHEFKHPDGAIDSGGQGNNQLLTNGGHFVGWGGMPYFTLFGASGATVVPPALLDGRLPSRMQNYRSFMFDWTGTPPESEIGLVVRAGAGTGNFTAWMSWNGATEIDSWQIDAGTSTHPSALANVGHKKKAGFQTIIGFTRVGANEFQAVALDIHGAVLGRSAIVMVSTPPAG